MRSPLARDVEARKRRGLPPAVARSIRRKAGVSQAELAAELGVHRMTVSNWERRSRSPNSKKHRAYTTLLNELRSIP